MCKCVTATFSSVNRLGSSHYFVVLYFTYSKASRCYQKAFDLDPNSDDAGVALGDSLMELEDEVDKQFC